MKFIQPRRRAAAMSKDHEAPKRKIRKQVDITADRAELKTKIIQHLAKVDSSTPKKLAELLGVKVWQLHDILPGMVKAKMIVKEGARRTVVYKKGK
jgi:predicted HTH transcriptional regulator